MWKFKKGEVVLVKKTAHWGHVVGFIGDGHGNPRIKVELETGNWFAYTADELETEVDL